MIEILKLQQLISKQNVETAFERLDKQKNINTYDAVIITTYLLKDTLGLRKTLKILYGFGLTHL